MGIINGINKIHNIKLQNNILVETNENDSWEEQKKKYQNTQPEKHKPHEEVKQELKDVKAKEAPNPKLSNEQVVIIKKIADLIFNVQNLYEIHNKGLAINPSVCTETELQDLQDLMFKTSGLKVFGDDARNEKKSPLLSNQYANIKICDFNSDPSINTNCFPEKTQHRDKGISKFISKPNCDRAHQFFQYPDDDPNILTKIKIMNNAFYDEAERLSGENDLNEQIIKFCTISDLNQTNAYNILCNEHDLNISEFILQ